MTTQELFRTPFLPLATGLLVFAGCATSRPQAHVGRPAPPAEYAIGVDDVLEVTVWKEPGLSTTAPVKSDGTVAVPLAGDVAAAGRTTRTVGEDIAKRLSRVITSPVVNVVVKEVNAGQIYVLGEVSRPGVYRARSRLTLLQALAIAGGPTEFAGGEIIVLRPGPDGKPTRMLLDYERAIEGDDPYDLAPGDTVVVP